VSILNNLLINAIEACGDKGAIQVSESIEKDTVIFEVQDSAAVLRRRTGNLFFSRLFDQVDRRTGAMSTGLGLSHVQNLTKLLGGKWW
jgi:two-component system sensor histidine kinase YcbA